MASRSEWLQMAHLREWRLGDGGASPELGASGPGTVFIGFPLARLARSKVLVPGSLWCEVACRGSLDFPFGEACGFPVTNFVAALR
jgi:hypothetical protein